MVQKYKDGMAYLDVRKLKWQHKQGRLFGPKLMKFLIIRRDGFKCVKCGSTKYLTVDRKREKGECGRKRME